MATPRLKTKLNALAKQARQSGQSEFRCLTDFLCECFEPNNQENKTLLMAICDEFIDHATYLKKELSKCQK
jgi:hypothetical protein